MEIITIDSSDEESLNSSNTSLVTPREFEIDVSSSTERRERSYSDSSSSHDSIWEKGIVCRIPRDGAAAGSRMQSELLEGAAGNTRNAPCVALNLDAGHEKHNPDGDDSSSISCNDSIWKTFDTLNIDKFYSQAQNLVDKESNAVRNNTPSTVAVVGNALNSDNQTNGFTDDSSVSSIDSILQMNYFERKKPSDRSASLVDLAREREAQNKSIEKSHDCISDDDSVSSIDSILQKTYIERNKPPRDNVVPKAQKPLIEEPDRGNSDSNSISSSDSILQKTSFERKKHPIHSYYDYCKYYPNNSKPANESVDEKEVAVVPKEQTSITTSTSTVRSNKHQLLPEFIQPPNSEWQIILLMDHREFGCSNNFLQQVETEINKYFGRKQCEITTLPSADYLYVARLISTAQHKAGEILQERVLDMVIERKAVQDVCQCLITDSKKCKPLSFFEAQMYKLMCCGVGTKLFVMEGDEDKVSFGRGMMHGARSKGEKDRRLKRVKTLRLQLANGEFEGVQLVCTKSRHDTVKFLIHQLKEFQESFDPMHPPLRTRESLKRYIDRQMKAPTFLEYLRLRSIPSIGDVKAMKVIMDPNLDWDKNFVSPASSKKSKATLEDKAAFWKAPASIHINTYIKAKSTKNSSRRTADVDRNLEPVSTVESTKPKAKKGDTSKAPKPKSGSRGITSFFQTNTENGADIMTLLVSDDEKENTAS